MGRKGGKGSRSRREEKLHALHRGEIEEWRPSRLGPGAPTERTEQQCGEDSETGWNAEECRSRSRSRPEDQDAFYQPESQPCPYVAHAGTEDDAADVWLRPPSEDELLVDEFDPSLVMSNLLWFYLDLDGGEHGPVSSATLRSWLL